MALVTIDPGSTTPPFAQVRLGLLALMQSGELPAGAKLPTVRRFAADLGVAPGTIARAYRELEAEGAIETHGRAGTIVAWSADAGERRVQELASELVGVARELGVNDEGVRSAVEAALRA